MSEREQSALGLGAVLAASLLLRLFFFTGVFGSDEVTYTEQALQVVQGSWERSDYIGAVRLGITLPVGAFLLLFGTTEFVANLWSLLCSLAEIALVFLLAHRFWGLRAALLASLMLAFTPLHAHYGGRLMADAPLAFFITLTFFLVFWGDRSGKLGYSFGAGLAAGFVWWIKSSVALVFVLVFVLYVVRERRVAGKWFVMAAGFIAALLLNGLVFLVMENDFSKIWRMTTSGVAEYVQDNATKMDPAFYLRLLFLDVKHTWFLGPLAAVGIVLWGFRGRRDDGLTRVALWALGLLGVFSLFVVSFTPLLFITKQANYATIFLAPLALLAGYALSRLSRAWSVVAVALVVVPAGVIGTALEQQAIHSFVANSKATLAFASAHPGTPVFSMTNALRISNYARIFASAPETVPRIEEIHRLATAPVAALTSPDAQGFVAYAVFDRQTAGWGRQGAYSTPAGLPSCWVKLNDLEAQGMGSGARVVIWLRSLADWLPTSLGHRVARALDDVIKPKAATVYGVPVDCLPR